MAFKAVANHAPVIVTARYPASGAADGHIFIADRFYEIVEVLETHSTAGAGSTTLQLEKCAAGTAPASGEDILATVFALDSTANTPVVKQAAVGAALTAARFLSPGDAIAADFTGTVTAYVGVVQVVLKPLPGRI